MKIIFFLPAGVIEWPVPEAQKELFNFAGVVTSTRSTGFFMAENLYLRHEAMIGMSFAPDDVAPVMPVRRDLN